MVGRFPPASAPGRHGRALHPWAALFLTAVMLAPAHAQEPAVTLDAGDEVQITVFGEPDFSGKYTVDAAGALALPWAGRLTVRGESLAQLEQDLIASLKAGFLGNPKLIASIAAYRPIYVMGDVRTPGKYPFADGTTMLQAVAEAGGFRVAETADVRLAQDYVRAEENAKVLLVDLRRALAMSARLTAERDGSPDVPMPQELLDLGASEAREAIADETRLLASRRQAFDGEIELLEKQKQGFLEEINALNGQASAKDQQRKLLQEELDDVTTLFNRGIERKPQLLLLQRNIAEADSDRLQIVAYLARAKQNLAGTELSVVNKRSDRAEEVLRQLLETGDRLLRLRTQRRAALDLLDKTEALLNGQGAAAGDREKPHVLRVTRRTKAGAEAFVADNEALAMPGDLIEVLRPEKPGADLVSSSGAAPPIALR